MSVSEILTGKYGRTRLRAHLERLIEALPRGLGISLADIGEAQARDHPVRVLVSRAQFGRLLGHLGDGIRYGNFKAACASAWPGDDLGFVPALHDTWARLRWFQRDAQGPETWGRREEGKPDGPSRR